MGIAWTVSEIMQHWLFSWFRSVWLWMKVKGNAINTWCITMYGAVARPSLTMITSTVSEKLSARDTHTHARTHTRAHTHTHALTRTGVVGSCKQKQDCVIIRRCQETVQNRGRKASMNMQNVGAFLWRHCFVFLTFAFMPKRRSASFFHLKKKRSNNLFTHKIELKCEHTFYTIPALISFKEKLAALGWIRRTYRNCPERKKSWCRRKEKTLRESPQK